MVEISSTENTRENMINTDLIQRNDFLRDIRELMIDIEIIIMFLASLD